MFCCMVVEVSTDITSLLKRQTLATLISKVARMLAGLFLCPHQLSYSCSPYFLELYRPDLLMISRVCSSVQIILAPAV